LFFDLPFLSGCCIIFKKVTLCINNDQYQASLDIGQNLAGLEDLPGLACTYPHT